MKKKSIITNTCNSCIFGEYDYNFLNLDIYGEPTLINCKHKTYKQVRGQRACNMYNAKIYN